MTRYPMKNHSEGRRAASFTYHDGRVFVGSVRENGRLPTPPVLAGLARTVRALAIGTLMLLVSTSCMGPEGMISADAIADGVDIVTRRHDAMLKGELDPSTLSEQDRATALRTSELLRGVVDAARGGGGQ